MSIITSGYGKGSSPTSIILQGYGLTWKEKVIIGIERQITRFLPYKRKPFKKTYPMTGSVIIPFKKTVWVKGKKSFWSLLWLLLEDEEDE